MSPPCSLATGHVDNPGDPVLPRAEYPRPQFVRDRWFDLNGSAWICELEKTDG